MSSAGKTNYKVAAVQAAPEFLDVEKALVKAIRLIEEAASNGASLIAFPEVWIPGYPWWIWVDSPAWGMQFVRRYFENSVEVGDKHFERIREAAAANNIYVVMGFSERAGGRFTFLRRS
jgi:aliphatic nitrilase